MSEPEASRRSAAFTQLQLLLPATNTQNIIRFAKFIAALLTTTLGSTYTQSAELVIGAGITEPICDVTLSPSVAGIVSAWKVKEGDFVREGDVILELDKALEELELKRRVLVVENRKDELDALQTLVKKSSISVKKEDLIKAETEYNVAVAEQQIAAEQLRRRSITAPCSGTVAEFYRRVGEACQTYQPLARVTDTRQCYFVSNVEARAGAGLKTGQAVRLEIEAFPAPLSVRGKIIFLSPVVDPASGLQKVKALFDNSEGRIRPGIAGRMYSE